MSPLFTFYRSSVGKKIVVAVTGFFLILFVVGHLLGNLQIFLGWEYINAYALKLQQLGPALWVIRLTLLAILVLHIWSTISLAIGNKKARASRYSENKPKASTFSSRTMAISGLLIFSFIIFHLLHFTFRWTHPEYWDLHDPLGHHDVYSMMILGFQQPLISIFYILSMFLLAMHLSHGFASVFQSIGARNNSMAPALEKGGWIFSWLIFAGYSLIPLAVLFGFVELPEHFIR